MTEFDDAILKTALAPARSLEPTEDEIARWLERADQSRSPRRPNTALLMSIAALLLCGAVYSVPPTRAAVDDVAGSFMAWVSGEESQAPGRALRPEDDAPWWVSQAGGRLVAASGDVKLYVTRVEETRDGTLLGFSYGDGVSALDTVEGWRGRFDEHAVVILGAPPIEKRPGRFSLVGVTGRSVRRVELRYDAGPPAVAKDVDGGFVLLGDADRQPQEIIAYSADGQELEKVDVSNAAR